MADPAPQPQTPLPPPGAIPAPTGGDVRDWQVRCCNFFFLLIILRVPFFDVPCGKGRCTAPLDVVATELYAYNKAPHDVIRLLLFPRVLADGLAKTLSGDSGNATAWKDLLAEFENVTIKDAQQQPFPSTWAMFKEAQMDLIGGSFIVLVGAVMTFTGPNFGASAGMALLFLYVLREGARFTVFMGFAAGSSLAWIPFHLLFEGRPGKAGVTSPRPAARPAPRLKTKGKFKVY